MTNLLRAIVFLLLIISVGCKKESNISATAVPPRPIIIPIVLNSTNSIGSILAGRDIYIDLPDNSCSLKGSVQYPQNLSAVSWSKISGPSSGEIENAGSLETKLTDLSKGNYKFELSIVDKASVTSKDTVTVIVSEIGSGLNELIFSNLQWGCPMGCHLRIENFHHYIPSNTSFKVFVRRDNSTQWTEALEIHRATGKYMWTIYNNGLEILEDGTELDPKDTPDVKITF